MLTKLSSLIRRVSNRRSFLILLVTYGVYFSIFFYADVPFGISQIKPYAGRAGILDVETYYTAAQAYQRLDLFGEQGRATYQRILMGDLIYPALLGLLLSVAITLVLRQVLPANSRWHKLNLLPIANLTADYLENILLITLLAVFPTHLDGVALLAGWVTFTKHIFGMLSFLALGTSLVVWLYQRIARRSGELKGETK